MKKNLYLVLIIFVLINWKNIYSKSIGNNNYYQQTRFKVNDISYKNSINKSLGIGLESHINFDELSLGLSLYPSIIDKIKLSAALSIHARPYAKRVLIRETENEFYILREYRYSILIGLDKVTNIKNKFNVFTTVLFGSSQAFYRGSNREESSMVNPVINVGLSLGEKSQSNSYESGIKARIGYQFFNLTSNKNRIFISLILYFF